MKTTYKGYNLLLSVAIATLIGCAATQTVLEHRTLETSTKMSETIFLEPVSSSQKTVYVSIRNTSDQPLTITSSLKRAFSEKGYRVMKDPTQAHYLLQANVLQVGQMSIAASQSALGGGYGSAIAGAIAGTAAGSFSNSSTGMMAGGLAGGVIGMAADSLVKDVHYTLITDVQISARVAHGTKVQEQFHASLTSGSASHLNQTATRTTDYQRYQTRIVSHANQVNLKFSTARPVLEHGLVQAMVGIF